MINLRFQQSPQTKLNLGKTAFKVGLAETASKSPEKECQTNSLVYNFAKQVTSFSYLDLTFFPGFSLLNSYRVIFRIVKNRSNVQGKQKKVFIL